jgi:hypothetical protein
MTYPDGNGTTTICAEGPLIRKGRYTQKAFFEELNQYVGTSRPVVSSPLHDAASSSIRVSRRSADMDVAELRADDMGAGQAAPARGSAGKGFGSLFAIASDPATKGIFQEDADSDAHAVVRLPYCTERGTAA